MRVPALVTSLPGEELDIPKCQPSLWQKSPVPGSVSHWVHVGRWRGLETRHHMCFSHPRCSELRDVTFPRGTPRGGADRPSIHGITFKLAEYSGLPVAICFPASFSAQRPFREWDPFHLLESRGRKAFSRTASGADAFEKGVMFDTEMHQRSRTHFMFVVWVQHWNPTHFSCPHPPPAFFFFFFLV